LRARWIWLPKEFSVNKADLPYRMGADPNPFDTVENLERHLAELRARPDYLLKDSDIRDLQKIIEIAKQHGGE
jgi:hypothetical protein